MQLETGVRLEAQGVQRQEGLAKPNRVVRAARCAGFLAGPEAGAPGPRLVASRSGLELATINRTGCKRGQS